MRIGIFGGSFDPVHYGHLLLAELCAESCALDRVWFLPASVPPHKHRRPLASQSHRVEMLQLAISGNERFEVSLIEIQRGGLSYTADTLREIRKSRPEDDLYFLMGADSLSDLPSWREPDEIVRLAQLAIVERPDAPEAAVGDLEHVLPTKAARPVIVSMPVIGLSSSEIRRRVAERRSIRYWLPRAVEKYIESHSLYTAKV